MEMQVKQYTLTVAAGKRLIAKAIATLPSVEKALAEHTVVITAGTTNGYLAEEILTKLGQLSGFAKERFFRGITFPPHYKPRDADQSQFLGDVVVVKGEWQRGLTIFDVAAKLELGDLIIKGANAVNLADKEAAVLIGHSQAGTIGAAILPVIGRRVELVMPVGLEKRVTDNIGELAQLLNSANATGPRYFPVKGNIITELEAIQILTGAEAKLVAAGGVCGAEGANRIAVIGSPAQISQVDDIYDQVIGEPSFIV